MNTTRIKRLLTAGLTAAVLTVPIGALLPSTAGALGTSPFCKTIFAFKPTNPPTSYSVATYHAWAKSYLPLYQKLASEAPNSNTKKILNEIVTILTYEASSTSATSLQAYALAHETDWVNGAKALASAILACA